MDNDDETLVNLTGSDADDDTTGTNDRGDEVLAGEGQAPASTDVAEESTDPTTEVREVRGIPKTRFNEVNEERKAALRANEEKDRLIAELLQRTSGTPATGAAPAAPVFDESDMERQYYDAVMEGDRDKGVAIRREINAHQQRVAVEQYRSLQSAENTMAALDGVTQKTLEDYPWLDTPEGDEVLEMIIALRDRKIQGGTPAHLALSQAVSAIAPAFAPEGKPVIEGKVDRRTAVAVARGVADSGRQPPSLRGMGNRSTAGRVDVAAMTEAQFDALSADEIKRLRGDFEV